MEKSRFNLTSGQFMLSKYKTIKGLHWIACVGFLTKEAWISKILLKNWHLSDFISTTRLWIDMIFEIWELIPEQDCQTGRTLTEFVKSLTKMTSTLLNTPWKVDHLGAIQWTLRRKTSSIQINRGAKKESDDESSKSIKVMFSIWQWQRKNFLIIDRWTSIQINLGQI
jgi:hypothetical protein